MENNKVNDDKRLRDALVEGYVLFTIVENLKGEDSDYIITEVNKQVEVILEVSKNQVLGKSIKEALPLVYEIWSDFSKELPKVEETVKFEFYFNSVDRYFLISAFKPDHNQMIILFTDISIQKKAQEAFQLHEVLFENAHDIMLYIRLNGQIVHANKQACEQYGYTKKQLISMRIQDIRHPSTVSQYEHQMNQADMNGIVFESIHLRSDGSSFPVEVSAKTTYTERGRFRIHIIRDITKRKADEEKILWLAKYDSLTGIPNRANIILHLNEEIKRSLRQETSFAVMMFDIDQFKYFNDYYGHEAGDIVLKHVATEAQNVLRDGDQIGRLGGDEFVVLLTGVETQSDILKLVSRIQQAVHKEITYKNAQLCVRVSMGISMFPQDAREVNDLLHCADQAMYKVKRDGGNGFCFMREDENIDEQT